MAAEISFDLIQRLQTTTREEAGLSRYDPDDPALGRLPTFEEAVLGLDPDAPPYLRCRSCQGKLLRGLQTMVCVYCGSEQRKDGLPLTLSFNSTTGCRKLLEALDLDGSEPVTMHADSRDSGKSEGMMKAGLFLSDLLDLEMVWPPEEEEEVKGSTSKMPTPQYPPSLNVSSIDLDNFFSEPKGSEDSYTLSMPQHVSQMELISRDSHLSSQFGSLEEFENIESKDSAQGSAEAKTSDLGDSFAEWDADFQSVGSENLVADAKPVDLCQGPPSDTFNKLTDRESRFNNGSNDQRVASEVEQHFSTNDSRTPHEFWHSKDIKISDTGVQMKTNTNNTTIAFNIKSNNFVAANELPSGAKLLNDLKNADNDSFDTWQDFTSSQGAPEISSTSWTKINGNSMSSNKCSHELNTQNKIYMLDDMGFGGFSQPVPHGMTPVRSDLVNKNLVVMSDSMECSDSCLSSSPAITAIKNDRTDKDEFHTNLTDKIFFDNFKDMEFGSFFESSPSGIKDPKNDLVNMRNIESNTSLANRASVLDDVMTMGARMDNSTATAKTEPSSVDVADLLSQMNDLSFMLESKLSIPEKNSDSVP